MKAHLTRSTSTSWAVYNKSSFMSVLRAADWRCDRTFTNHYGLDLWKKSDNEFGKKVLAVGGSNKQ